MFPPALLTLCLAFTSTALALPRPQNEFGAPPGYLIPWYWYTWPGFGKPVKLPGSKGLSASGDVQFPEESEAVNVVARDSVVVDDEDKAGVYICEDVAWGGACTHHRTPLGSDPAACTAIGASASSIGPDPGFFCIFYTNALCTPLASDGSDTLALSFPGTGNLLATDKGDYNDRLLSFQCFREPAEEEPEIGVPPNVVPPNVVPPGPEATPTLTRYEDVKGAATATPAVAREA